MNSKKNITFMQKNLIYMLTLSFTIALVLLSALPVQAENESSEVVRVGYIRNYGMGTIDCPEMYGYTYEYLNKLSEYTGWRYEFVECTGKNYFEKLQNGEIDLAGPVQYSEDRAQNFLFSSDVMLYGFQYLVSNEDSSLYYEDFQNFDNMKIGITHGSFYEEAVLTYAKANDFTPVIVAADGPQISRQLQKHEYDAAVITSILYLPHIKVIGQLNTVPFYFATASGNAAIMDELDSAMHQILQDEPYYNESLYQKCYGSTVMAPPAYTREDAAFIQDSGVYRVACSPDWAPFEQLNRDAGSYSGIDISILNALADKSGLQFEYLPSESYEQSLQLIHDGQADLLLGDTELYPSSDVIYTDAYLEIPLLLVSHRPIDISYSHSIAIAGITNGVYAEIAKQYPGLQFTSYGNTPNVVDALLDNREETAIMDLYSFNEVVRKESLHSYFTLNLPVSLSLRIGVSKQTDPLMLSTLNTTLKRLNTEEKTTILFNSTSHKDYKTALTLLFREHYLPILGSLCGLFLLILLFIIFNLRSKKRAVENIAYVDALTGLPTAAKFRIDAEQLLRTATPDEYMLIYLDINNFQYINSLFGYEIGDKLLRSLATLFLKRKNKNNLFARLSADNFLMMFKTVYMPQLHYEVSEDAELYPYLQDVLSNDYRITYSIGVCPVHDPHMRIDTIIDNANQARKSIKGKHSNGIAVYDDNLRKALEEEKEIATSMEHALVNNEFEVYLQPKISLSTKNIFGAEALVRWKHPSKGTIMPDQFIPLFERNGFIQQLDFYMFDHVCQLISRWEQQYPAMQNCLVSVNLSRYCISYQNLSECLLHMAQKNNVDPSHIEIELTEGIAINNLDYLKTVMQNLKNYGFHISIDDFGSGYSSLALLTQLPADTIKIDRSFLTENYSTENGKAVILEIIRLIQTLHMQTIAEGVENTEQAEQLRKFGCNLAQGFLYGRPMPTARFAAEYLESDTKKHQ